MLKFFKSEMAIISATHKFFEMKVFAAQMVLCSSIANAPTRRFCKEAK